MTQEIIRDLRNAKGFAHPHAFVALPEYTNWREEQMSWMKTACIGDWSFVSKGILKGPGAMDLLKAFSVNNFDKFGVGQAKHMINCDENGKVITEGLIMRVGAQEFNLYSRTAYWFAYQASFSPYKDTVTVHIEPEPETAMFQIAGPHSLYLLEEVAQESLRDLKFMHFRAIQIAGHEVIAINGCSMAGETGFELQFPSVYRDDVLSAIFTVGQTYGLRELGARNHQINHLLACFPTVGFHYLPALFGPTMDGFWRFMQQYSVGEKWRRTWKIKGSFEGADVSDYYRSPIEMGWARNIKLDHEFLGRRALEAELEHPKRSVVTLEFANDDVLDIYASHFAPGEPYEFMDVPIQYQVYTRADAVIKDGKLVGVSSGPGYSYYFRKMLALAFVDIDCAQMGTNVEVIWGNPGTRQKTIRATVTPAPYKRDTRKIDLTTLPSKPTFSIG